LKFKKILQGFL